MNKFYVNVIVAVSAFLIGLMSTSAENPFDLDVANNVSSAQSDVMGNIGS